MTTTLRTITNVPGVTYVPAKTDVIYAEDMNAIKTKFTEVTAGPEKATGAELNTGTDDAKYATAKALADSDYAKTSDIPSVPTKATGAELNTGTDDAKYATAKALNDSHNVPSVAPGNSGNVMASNGTDWVSQAPSGGGGFVLSSTMGATYSPNNGNTYYFGDYQISISSINYLPEAIFLVPKACTLKIAAFYVGVGTTLGTTETATVSIRKNDTTDYQISNAVLHSAAKQNYINSTINTAFSAGDYLQIKVVCPNWATKPTAVKYQIVMYFE